MIELLVAMIVLGSVMTVAATMIYRADLVWRDTAQQRVAIAELSNQLEALTLLSPAELSERLLHLKASDECRQTLFNPTLSARLIEDALGKRLILELDWQRQYPAAPVQLAAWAGPGSEPDVGSTAPREDD